MSGVQSEIAVIIFETKLAIEKLEKTKIVYNWGAGKTLRMLEISGLKAMAYDRIVKFIEEDS